MNISDKIMLLRKKRGLSQEELADMLDVTRQSVSKWESGQSVPDIQKIVQLSAIFGVSCDSLLKDEPINDLAKPISKKVAKKIDKPRAEVVLSRSKIDALTYAIAVALFVLSPLTLILLNLGNLPEKLGYAVTVTVGVISLIVLVAVGVGLVIFRYLRRETVGDGECVAGEVKQYVEQSKNSFVPIFTSLIICGVTLCLVSVIPVLVCWLMFADYLSVGIAITDIAVAAAVALFVVAGVRWAAYDKLLGLGSYSEEGRRMEKVSELIGAIYWPAIVVIYLASSFISGKWDKTWIIWPIAAVLFAVVAAITEVVVRLRNRDDKQ